MRQPLMFQGVDQIVAEPAQFLPAQIGLEQRLQLLAVFLPYDLSGSDVCLCIYRWRETANHTSKAASMTVMSTYCCQVAA